MIGTAGWSIATVEAQRFPAEGTGLERYASVFRGAEINSSFHRPHRLSTWQRWADSVPDHFRFSVKMPKTISHQKKLVGCEEEVARFLEEAHTLGGKLAILLLQLPPSFAFDPALTEGFVAEVARRTSVRLACEPRHPSWFEAEADGLLSPLGVARVAADPAVVPAAALPGGCADLAYWRLHGSPVKYRSVYGAERLRDYSEAMRAVGAAERWCIFDNTASSAATGDALALQDLLRTVGSAVY